MLFVAYQSRGETCLLFHVSLVQYLEPLELSWEITNNHTVNDHFIHHIIVCLKVIFCDPKWNGPLLVNKLNTVWVTTKYKAVHLERRLAEPGNHLAILLRTKGYGVMLCPFGIESTTPTTTNQFTVSFVWMKMTLPKIIRLQMGSLWRRRWSEFTNLYDLQTFYMHCAQ